MWEIEFTKTGRIYVTYKDLVGIYDHLSHKVLWTIYQGANKQERDRFKDLAQVIGSEVSSSEYSSLPFTRRISCSLERLMRLLDYSVLVELLFAPTIKVRRGAIKELERRTQ